MCLPSENASPKNTPNRLIAITTSILAAATINVSSPEMGSYYGLSEWTTMLADLHVTVHTCKPTTLTKCPLPRLLQLN